MAYRVIIADDEPKILRLIKMLGHWEKYQIETSTFQHLISMGDSCFLIIAHILGRKKTFS